MGNLENKIKFGILAGAGSLYSVASLYSLGSTGSGEGLFKGVFAGVLAAIGYAGFFIKPSPYKNKN